MRTGRSAQEARPRFRDSRGGAAPDIADDARRTIVVPDREARWWSERLPNAGRANRAGRVSITVRLRVAGRFWVTAGLPRRYRSSASGWRHGDPAPVRPLAEVLAAAVVVERHQQDAVELQARRAVDRCVGAVPVSHAPLLCDGQQFVGKPDVAPCRWQIRPVRADRFSAPQRLIKWCLPIGPPLTE